MIDIASDPTNRVKIPDRKAARNEIKALFSKYLTSLKSRLNVCTRLMELIRCLNSCRVQRCASRQTSHAMRGRPAIQKATLQLQAIGLKSQLPRAGSSRAHYSDLHSLTTPMMGSDSVRRYTKLLSVSELSTRSVRVLSSHVYAPPDHASFRLATSLATTQITMARC